VDNVPDGAVRYSRRRQSARIAGLAAYCAAVAIALGVVAVAVFLRSLPHFPPVRFPSPGTSLTCGFPSCEVPLRSGPKMPDVLLVQIAGIGSVLAGIGAIACGTVAVIKLRPRKRDRSVP